MRLKNCKWLEESLGGRLENTKLLELAYNDALPDASGEILSLTVLPCVLTCLALTEELLDSRVPVITVFRALNGLEMSSLIFVDKTWLNLEDGRVLKRLVYNKLIDGNTLLVAGRYCSTRQGGVTVHDIGRLKDADKGIDR